MKFWSQYLNPSSGTRNATIDAASVAASEGTAVAQDVAFTNGQAVVTAKYKDVGQIRLALKDDTTVNAELPAGIVGATANFVVRPYEFRLSGITDAAGVVANPQAVDASGPLFLAAGAPFRATVTVRDAEGDATPNYGREATPESVRMDVQIVAPVGGASPAVSSGVGFGSFVNGVATGTDFVWSEVGIMQVVPGVGDTDYLLAGDVTGSASERIGRFVPSHFVVGLNAPLFDTACLAGGFTYQGQTFDYVTPPMITATAVAVGGTTTTNYTGAFFKLSNSTLTGRTYSGRCHARHVGAACDDRRSRDHEPKRRRRHADLQRRNRPYVRQGRAAGAVPGECAALDRGAGRRRCRRGRRRAVRQSRHVRHVRRHPVHGRAGNPLRARARRHRRSAPSASTSRCRCARNILRARPWAS